MDMDNLRTGNANAVAHLISFAQITYLFGDEIIALDL